MKDKYWLFCIITKSNDIIEGECGKNGLLLRFKQDKIQHLLDLYPTMDSDWYFNSTFDRVIAEQMNNYIVCNPQLMWQNSYEIIT